MGTQMLIYVYSVCVWALAFFLAPVALVYAFFAKEKVAHRLGIWRNCARNCIWIHSSSLGEAQEALALGKIFSDEGFCILHTSTTMTGFQKLAQNTYNADVFLQPIDFPQVMSFLFRKVAPLAFITIESDMWIGMLHAARKANVPAIVASGRISDRSVLRAKYSRFYYRFVFAHLTKILARNAHDAQNFSQLGCDIAKLDIAPDLKIISSFAAVKRGIPPNFSFHGKKVIVWGSLREREERIAFDTIEIVKSNLSNVLHIIVPRKPENFDNVCNQLDARKIPFMRRSRVSSIEKSAVVLVVDTIGELAMFYTTADLAIVCGTFANYGGHNPLEAFAAGVPVLHGRDTANNRALFDYLNRNGVGFAVSAGELATKIVEIFANSDYLYQLQQKTRQLAQTESCAGQDYLNKILPLLKK